MIKSLYAGVSGMKSFQVKMDVVANNIANVNTTGFKSGRASFQDMLSQNVGNAQAATATNLGGVNARQIGLGVKVGSIGTMMTGGAPQATNRDLDFAIEGEGFFTLSNDANGTNKLYTRDGAFYRDNTGNVVNSSGLRVLGYKPASLAAGVPITDFTTIKPLNIPEKIGTRDLQSYAINGSGEVIGVYSDTTTSSSILLGQVATTTFSNPSGLTKTGGNNYAVSDNSGAPKNGVAGTPGYGTILQGFLEMSNVDLANEFTDMIVTSRAYQANAKTITTSDEMLQELIGLKR